MAKGVLSEEDAAEYRLLRARASEAELRLARALQTAAMPHKVAELEADFEPAPLYLRQAAVLADRPELRDDVAALLDQMPRPARSLC